MSTTSNRYQVSIEADPDLPIIRMTRDFDATADVQTKLLAFIGRIP